MLDLRSIHLGSNNIAAFARKSDAVTFAKANRWTARDTIKAYNRFNIFYVIGQCFEGETWIYHFATKDGSVIHITLPDNT